MKFEKSAQPVSEFEVAVGEELHAASGEAEDKGEDAAGLVELEVGAVDVPVSMGMSSKFAVHTGPIKEFRYKKEVVRHHIDTCSRPVLMLICVI